MDGRGDAMQLSDEQSKPTDDVIIFYRNLPLETKDWQPLTPGFSRAPRYRGGLPSATFGPEIGFVLEMRASHPNRKIALIKASEGGTNLRADWHPGEAGQPDSQGRCYRNLLDTVVEATNRLKEQGDTYKIRGLLWHQGESDAKVATNVHHQRLARLIERFREDFDSPSMPVVLGQVIDNGQRNLVRRAIIGAAEQGSNVHLVDADGLSSHDEGTHFDAPSQLELGRRFAKTMLSLARD